MRAGDGAATIARASSVLVRRGETRGKRWPSSRPVSTRPRSAVSFNFVFIPLLEAFVHCEFRRRRRDYADGGARHSRRPLVFISRKSRIGCSATESTLIFNINCILSLRFVRNRQTSRDKGVFRSRACPNPFPDVRPQKTRYSSPSQDFYLIILLLSYRNNIVVRSAAVIFPLKITRDVNNVFIFFFFLRRRSPPPVVFVGRWWRTVQTPSVPPPVCTSFSCLRFSRGCCC